MPRQREKLPQVIAYLTEHGETRAGDLAVNMGLSASRIARICSPGVDEGLLVRRQELHGTWYSLGDGTPLSVAEDEVDEPQKFNASLWADGDLDLYGVTELDGGGVRISPDGVRLLCRLLHGQGPEL